MWLLAAGSAIQMREQHGSRLCGYDPGGMHARDHAGGHAGVVARRLQDAWPRGVDAFLREKGWMPDPADVAAWRRTGVRELVTRSGWRSLGNVSQQHPPHSWRWTRIVEKSGGSGRRGRVRQQANAEGPGQNEQLGILRKLNGTARGGEA
jgi:hypothetical protein